MKVVQRIRQTSKKIWPAYIILAFVVVFFGKNILAVEGNFIGGIDVARYFFWHGQFIKEQILSGSIPLWNPYYYSGHPFVANPQTFVFYPATLLFVTLPLPWAFNIDTIGHICLAGLGIYCFVFIITQSKGAGLAAAVVYSLSGYFMDNIFAGHLTMLHTAALLPWIFYFVERAYKAKRAVFFLVSGLILGLQILSGEPQNNYYTVLFVTIYSLVRYFSTDGSFSFERFRRLGICNFLIPLVAFGVSAIQVLPSLEFMSLSDRAKNSYEFVTAYSFPPQCFFTFLVPNPSVTVPWAELQSIRELVKNWELSGYFGVLSIILAGIGGLFSKHRRHSLCLGIMLFVAITIMLGYYTPIFRFYYKFLPGISTFRIPARCLVIFVFSVAALVGFGVQHLCESPLTRAQHRIVLFGLAIMLLCVFAGAQFFRIPLASKEILLALGFIVSAFVVLNLLRFIKNKHFVAGILVVVLFTDLYLNYSHQTPMLNQDMLLQKTDYERLFEQDTGFYRVALPFDILRGMKFHYYGVNGYAPIALSHYFLYMHYMAEVPMSDTTRHTLNAELFQPDLVFSSKILGIKYAIVKTQSGYQLLAAQRVIPRAVLVRDAIVLPGFREQLEYIRRADFDPQREVLLWRAGHSDTGSVLETKRQSAKEDTVRIVTYQPNRIELESESDSNTYLVLSELFCPGWRAYVDGKEEPILTANFLLRAIPLTSGRHDIVFVYRPMSFLVGAIISLFTVLVLGCICLVYYRKKSYKVKNKLGGV